jgi:hypothetical protein
VAIAEGQHLFPYRTQQLSLPAPMVLRGRLRGRVGRCRSYLYKYKYKYKYKYMYCSLIAQSVEQMAVNHRVAGSSPARGAIFLSNKVQQDELPLRAQKYLVLL